MIGKTHGRFWKHFATLPVSVQKLAREKYALWKRDPFHASYQASASRLTFVSFAIFCSNHRNLKQKEAKAAKRGKRWNSENLNPRFDPVPPRSDL